MPKQYAYAYAAGPVPFDLKAWRLKHKINQKKLAEYLGTTEVRIWRLEQRGEVTREFIWALVGLATHIGGNNAL